MSRSTRFLPLAVLAGLLAGLAAFTGQGLLWVLSGVLGVAAAALFARAQSLGRTVFPTVDIQPEAEGHGAFLRLTNLDETDDFAARVRRVSLEDTLSEQPPWSVPWSGAAGVEIQLHRDESRRLEIGKVVPTAEDAAPEFHFARARVGGGSDEVSMPWPTGADDPEIGAGFATRRIRAEIEITSKRTSASRLVQVRVGVHGTLQHADVKLVSIDMGRSPMEVPSIA